MSVAGKPIAVAAVLVAVAAGAGGGAFVYFRGAQRTSTILLQRAYHPPESERADVIRLLGAEAAARAKAGLRAGRILVRVGGTSPSELLWECIYPDSGELVREQAAARADPAIRSAQQPLAQRSGTVDESRWLLTDGELPAGDERLIVRNHYFARPETVDEVFRFRTHASDVRVELGFARGRIWRRVAGPPSLPEVQFDLGSSAANAGEQHTREAALVQKEEFQKVMAHMRTLLRDFQIGTFRVAN